MPTAWPQAHFKTDLEDKESKKIKAMSQFIYLNQYTMINNIWAFKFQDANRQHTQTDIFGFTSGSRGGGGGEHQGPTELNGCVPKKLQDHKYGS